jgi:cytochrome P450
MTGQVSIPSLGAPEVTADPFRLYDRLRAEAPVIRNDELGAYMVTGYEEMMTVLRNPGTFSSEYYVDFHRAAKRSTEVRAILDQGFPPLNILAHADEPEHSYHRRLVEPFVNPRALRKVRPKVVKRVEEILDAIPPGTVTDFVQAVSVPLAVRVLCDFLGTPEEEQDVYARGADAEVTLLASTTTEEQARQAARDYVALQHCVARQVQDRKDNPGRDDPISHMVAAADRLSDQQIVRFVMGLIIAGNETSASLFTSMVLRLAQDPDLQDRVRGSETERDAFIEETLRFDPPIVCLYRVATRDTELGGVSIGRGELLAVFFGAANRDEHMFACPHVYDTARENARRHISFGSGIHVCVGSPVARLEAQLLVDELCRRYRTIELAEDGPLRYAPAYIVRSLESLAVRLG